MSTATHSSADSETYLATVPVPYGFAVAYRAADVAVPLMAPAASGSAVRASMTGVELVVRHYGDTPESQGDRLPLMTNGCLLVYEGRVDNRDEIARALGRPSLAGASDGVVLAAAHDHWGSRLSAHVVGEFAFVAIDRHRRRLVAGHDALGIRRVYYRAQGAVVWLCSNLQLLFACFPAAQSGFDEDVLPEYFAGPMQPWTGRTIWRGIREVGRGRALVVSEAHAAEETVWRPSVRQGGRRAPLDDIDAEFHGLVREGVARALRSPSPMLCDLSGGLDSAIVCGTAAALVAPADHPRALVAWSTAHPASNDASLQGIASRYFGVELLTLDVSHYLPFAALGHAALPTSGFVQCEGADAAMRAYCRRRGLRARLTGHGADVLLRKGRASPLYLSDWIREGRVGAWWRRVRRLVATGEFSAWHLVADCTVGSLDLHAGRFRAPLPRWFSPRFRSRVRDAQWDYVRQARVIPESVAREQIYRATLAFVPYHGEMLPDERMPLVYRPLVEFLLNVPWEALAGLGDDRPLLRRAFAHALPPALLTQRADSRHSATVIEGLRAAWPAAAPLLSGDSLAALGAVDPGRYRQAISGVLGGYLGENPQCLSTTLFLEPWLTVWADAQRRGQPRRLPAAPAH